MSPEDGVKAVMLARCTICKHLGMDAEDVAVTGSFEEMCGAFVTLKRHPTGMLRGCVGYPLPYMTMRESIVQSAIGACHDDRFPPLRPKDIQECTVEVTILTSPEEILHTSPEDLRSKIEIGRDGLMMELMGHRGLLLPQVPVEQGWDVTEYLQGISLKTCGMKDAWMRGEVSMKRFHGTSFVEDSPNGSIGAGHI